MMGFASHMGSGNDSAVVGKVVRRDGMCAVAAGRSLGMPAPR
jgi:hypothetical protein